MRSFVGYSLLVGNQFTNFQPPHNVFANLPPPELHLSSTTELGRLVVSRRAAPDADAVPAPSIIPLRRCSRLTARRGSVPQSLRHCCSAMRARTLRRQQLSNRCVGRSRFTSRLLFRDALGSTETLEADLATGYVASHNHSFGPPESEGSKAAFGFDGRILDHGSQFLDF
jgi:hypothetical protein